MRLTDCFIDLIAYVAYFTKRAATRQPHFDQVKADILRLLTESQNRTGRGNFSQEDYDLARFGMELNRASPRRSIKLGPAVLGA